MGKTASPSRARGIERVGQGGGGRSGCKLGIREKATDPIRGKGDGEWSAPGEGFYGLRERSKGLWHSEAFEAVDEVVWDATYNTEGMLEVCKCIGVTTKDARKTRRHGIRTWESGLRTRDFVLNRKSNDYLHLHNHGDGNAYR